MSKYKIYILITCILGVIIILATYTSTLLIREKINQNLIENYAQDELQIANNISKTLRTEIDSVKNLLILLGQNSVIRSGKTEECTEAIRKSLIDTNSKLGNIGRVGEDGLFRCSLNAALVGTKASNLGTYISDIFNDPTHQPVMSRAIKAPGAPGYLTAVHVPVWNTNGSFAGTIGGALYLIDIQEKYLKDITFAKRGHVVLVDDDGTILYHKFPELIGTNVQSAIFIEKIGDAKHIQEMLEDIKMGKSGTKQYLNVNEGIKIAGYVPVEILPGRSWLVMVTVPVDDARSDIQELGIDALLTQIWLFVALIVIAAEIGFILLSQKLIFKPIKQIQEMKSDFVSLVSHQLKTPVAQIKGYVENMLEGLTGPVNDKQKEYLHDMLNVANNNSKLIDDLLNVSRIERGLLKVELVSLNTNEVLQDVLKPLYEVAKKKGVALTGTLLEKETQITGDSVKTKEALRNIVDNAIKFTEVGKAVSLRAEEEMGKVKIKISDEGTGIDPDVQKELFEKNRVWSGKVKASGAGLGLFLSKQFIELTGGTITFETREGKGTTFIITLPKK